jgi:hypothetical protein
MATFRLIFCSLTKDKTPGRSDLSSLTSLFETAENVLKSPLPFTKAFIKIRDDWIELTDVATVEKDDTLLFLTATEDLPAKVSGTNVKRKMRKELLANILDFFGNLRLTRFFNVSN